MGSAGVISTCATPAERKSPSAALRASSRGDSAPGSKPIQARQFVTGRIGEDARLCRAMLAASMQDLTTAFQPDRSLLPSSLTRRTFPFVLFRMNQSARFLACFLFASTLFAAETKIETLPLGAPAPDFKLPGVDGKRHALRDFRKSPCLVVVFTCNHCPTAQYYEERLKKIVEDYGRKGVALVAISPNDPKSVRLDELGYTDL